VHRGILSYNSADFYKQPYTAEMKAFETMVYLSNLLCSLDKAVPNRIFVKRQRAGKFSWSILAKNKHYS
jgi:hypothetical protein